jgi:hypothetical protein
MESHGKSSRRDGTALCPDSAFAATTIGTSDLSHVTHHRRKWGPHGQTRLLPPLHHAGGFTPPSDINFEPYTVVLISHILVTYGNNGMSWAHQCGLS